MLSLSACVPPDRAQYGIVVDKREGQFLLSGDHPGGWVNPMPEDFKKYLVSDFYTSDGKLSYHGKPR